MIYLIHSSKTMRSGNRQVTGTHRPIFGREAEALQRELKKYSVSDIAKLMELSDAMASKTHTLIQDWTGASNMQTVAVSSFLGDIYSGLQVQNWNKNDWEFAGDHLKILSGLYGILRPSDSIFPYRLEMGYKFAPPGYKNLYDFWGDKIAQSLPGSQQILSLTAKEYEKVLTPYIDESRFVRPQFLTKHIKTGEYKQVIVHTKIARGALANWCIKNEVTKSEQLKNFAELGYRFDTKTSTKERLVFICDEFQGFGLSVRLI